MAATVTGQHVRAPQRVQVVCKRRAAGIVGLGNEAGLRLRSEFAAKRGTACFSNYWQAPDGSPLFYAKIYLSFATVKACSCERKATGQGPGSS
eukprot:205891-Rhodomonas_salina.1